MGVTNLLGCLLLGLWSGSGKSETMSSVHDIYHLPHDHEGSLSLSSTGVADEYARAATPGK